MDRKLLQEQVAAELGVSVTTIGNWEHNHVGVATRFLPKVLAFLGYDPSPEPETLPERIRRAREREGISQEALAGKLGLNVSTVTAWEGGRVRKLFPAVRRRFEEYVQGV